MIIFLDFDGVLHPDQAYMTRNGVVLRCDGHNLFEHADLLADLLEPYPHIEIVLSTSWVFGMGFDIAKKRLPERLQKRIIGATYHSHLEEKFFWQQWTRHEQIDRYVTRNHLTKWIAIDNDDDGWPDDKRQHLIHTDDWGGIGDKAAIDELIAKIQDNKP
jgi:hypothetical protein